jgi:hypothetical protein
MLSKTGVITVIAVLLITGCRNSANDNSQNNNPSYTIVTETFSKYQINAQYPQIRGLGDDSREAAINDLIKNDLFKSLIEHPIEYYKEYDYIPFDLIMDLDYKVTLQTPELLSILVHGSAQFEGAVRSSIAEGITIDLNEAKKLKLSDFVNIDNALIHKIKESQDVTNEAVENGMAKEHLIDAIQNIIQGDDESYGNYESTLRGLRDEEAYYGFCLTPNSLIVSIAIYLAAGDYALIEIPGQYPYKK